jgi:hypothetical protein
MKKIALLFFALHAIGANAQTATVPTTHKNLIMKFTADWCGPCGSWGWTEMETLIADSKAGSTNALVMAVHNSSSNLASLNINSAYNGLETNLDSNILGIPTFTVGKLNMAQDDAPTVKARVASTTSAAAEGNVGFIPSYSADGKTLTINTTTKFFSAASGTYSVAVYLVEDKVMAVQNGQGATAVANHNILRTPATGMTAFGQQLSGTSFTSGQTLSNTFTLPVLTTWNKANIAVYAVLWKKVGTQWDVANANSVATFKTGVENVANNVIAAAVYPNPASDNFTIALGQSINNCVIDMFDITGKKVAQLYNGQVNDDAIGINIQRPAGVANGMYILHINSDKGTQVMKMQLQ